MNQLGGIKYTLEQTIVRDKKRKSRSRKREKSKAMRALLGLIGRKGK